MHRAAFRRVGAKGRGVTSLKAPFRVQPCAGADSLPRRIHIRSDQPPSSTTTSSRPAPVHRRDSMLKSAPDAPFVQLWIRRPAKPSAIGSRAKSSVGAALTLRSSMTAKAGTGAGLVMRDRMSALPWEHESRCRRRQKRCLDPQQASIVVAAMPERFAGIRSPGGYLRALAAKAAAGQLSGRPDVTDGTTQEAITRRSRQRFTDLPGRQSRRRLQRRQKLYSRLIPMKLSCRVSLTVSSVSNPT